MGLQGCIPLMTPIGPICAPVPLPPSSTVLGGAPPSVQTSNWRLPNAGVYAGIQACIYIGETLGSRMFSSADKDASTPTGQRGSPINVKPGTNDQANIGGRDYTGHSLDQMQGRGVPPAAVEDTIQNGSSRPDKDFPGSRTEHRSPDGRVVVITDTGSGRVITVQTR
jgi:hypothetical protein